jgi:hypothetical protein
MTYTYPPTHSLCDDKGEALPNELERLHVAISFDQETGKKVRSGSPAVRADRLAASARWCGL